MGRIYATKGWRVIAASGEAPRIAFYGVGQYGLEAARIAIAKGWTIVAAYNRAGGKIGQDLGRLCGLDRDIGVIVEDCETADFAASGANIAINAVVDRLAVNLPGYRRMMNAGMNIICHGAESYFPRGVDPEIADEIEALAQANRVTFTGTGIWDYSRIWAGIIAAGPSTRIDSMFHRSVTDAESATLELARLCGVGMTQEEFSEKSAGNIGGLYRLISHHVVHALGYDVITVTERCEPVLSDAPAYSRLLDQQLAPGVVLGTRIVCEVTTRQGMTTKTHFELRILPEQETEHMEWILTGKPSTKIRVDRTDPVHSSAACMVHRIPDVLAADPGIRPVSQLGALFPKWPIA